MSKELLQQALNTLKLSVENDGGVAYFYDGDEIGMRKCCDVISYKKHHKDCWVVQAKSTIAALEAEVVKPEQDWDLLKSTQESLREHMSKVKELEELAKQTALDKKADNARELGLDYEPEQEPVSKYSDIVSDGGLDPRNKCDTAPPRKEWVGLTDEEEIELDEKTWLDINAYLKARDAKLKEKNS